MTVLVFTYIDQGLLENDLSSECLKLPYKRDMDLFVYTNRKLSFNK